MTQTLFPLCMYQLTNAKTKCSSTSVCPTSVPVHFKSPIPPNDSVMTNTSDLVQTKSSSASVSSKTTIVTLHQLS